MGKITVRNFTTLTDFSALSRAGLYLAGYEKEAEEQGFRFRVSQTKRGGTVVKITEKCEEPAGTAIPAGPVHN